MPTNIEVGNSNNIYTYAFNAAAGTITISSVTAYPLDKASLQSVYDVTVGADIPLGPSLSFSWSRVQDNPVYVWTLGLPQIPGGAANSDNLKIILQIPTSQADYSVLQKIAGATV